MTADNEMTIEQAQARIKELEPHATRVGELEAELKTTMEAHNALTTSNTELTTSIQMHENSLKEFKTLQDNDKAAAAALQIKLTEAESTIQSNTSIAQQLLDKTKEHDDLKTNIQTTLSNRLKVSYKLTDELLQGKDTAQLEAMELALIQTNVPVDKSGLASATGLGMGSAGGSAPTAKTPIEWELEQLAKAAHSRGNSKTGVE